MPEMHTIVNKAANMFHTCGLATVNDLSSGTGHNTRERVGQ